MVPEPSIKLIEDNSQQLASQQFGREGKHGIGSDKKEHRMNEMNVRHYAIRPAEPGQEEN